MSSAEEVLGAWVIKYTDDQKSELKPWLRCDGRGKYSYIEYELTLTGSDLLFLKGPDIAAVSVKGARHNNEDTSFGDGRLFAVFDGHGGKFASQLLRKKLAEHFYSSITSTELLSPAAIVGSPPKIVQALDAAFMRSQDDMPSEFPAAQSGSTGVACWVHGDNGASKVFASCLGDSKALMFNVNTGVIPQMDVRTWDQEVGTLKGPGVVSPLRAETFCHNLTGALINGRDGKWTCMDKDPNGVGFREFELLSKRHSFPQSRKPYNISNMPGEERWRVLDVEPTRALGHKLKREHPLHHPETQEWVVTDPKNTILMLSCDGFFSKEAFGTPDHVTRFLTDPATYCKDPNLFQGTCLKALLERLNETHKLPDPSAVDMGTLFERIRNVVFSKLSDETWTTAYDAAYQYLRKFAQEKPVPNIRTHPVKTLLAACYFAVLLVSDDNVSVSVVFLDGVQRFNGRLIEAGICP